MKEENENVGRISVLFTYIDARAEKVSIAGDFNRWSPDSHVMVRNGDRWSLKLSLSPGRYRYLLVIDDQIWREDPSSVLSEDNGFGTRNSVLIVE